MQSAKLYNFCKKTTLVDIAVIFGANRSRAEIEVKEALEFEMKLANISLAREELANLATLYNPLTLREMQQRYPYVQWVEYINFLLPSSLKVDENEVVVLATPSYFDKLETILNETPSRAIANLLMWRVVSYSTNFLSDDLRRRKSEFKMTISGQKGRTARWKKCVAVTQSLSIAVGSMYVRKYFREDSKATALDMVSRVRAEFEIILKEVNWMDEDTRRTALKKLRAISTYIGYADELIDNLKIEQFYKKLEVDESSYLSFALSINSFAIDQSFGELFEPRNKTGWMSRISPFVANAFYAPHENGIQFAAAILQGHFFSAQRPRYMNYGAVGVVIGHELTHGFDNIGRQFDFDGNLVDWWHPDNGGIQEAYLAYQRWDKENGPEPKLPGLSFTPQQLFWISSAQNWCSVFRPELMKRQVKTDPNPPAQFRVIGPMSNQKEFATDFQCPEGSPMNPVKKCEVW